MGTSLVYSLDSTSGEYESNSFLQFWYINALLLEIRILAHRASRVELGSTSPVGVASTHNGSLF